MKRLGLWVIGLALGSTLAGRGQDAATEEKFRQLSGSIQNLTEGQDTLSKELAKLSREVEALKEQQNRPAPNYATLDQVNRLAKAVEERLQENEKLKAEVLRLIETVKAASLAPDRRSHGATSSGKKRSESPPADNPPDNKGGGAERFYEYRVAKGDRLSTIVAAYREKHVMVTVEQVLKANPHLKPETLQVGMKIYIPMAKSE